MVGIAVQLHQQRGKAQKSPSAVRPIDKLQQYCCVTTALYVYVYVFEYRYAYVYVCVQVQVYVYVYTYVFS